MKLKILTIIISITLLFSSANWANSFTWATLNKIVKIVQQIADYIDSIRTGTGAIATVPTVFPFGGHITSSERACEFRFRVWVWITTPYTGPIPIPCPSCGFIPLGGRAIIVGPPVASPGKIITFPFISDIYRNYSEKRVGPWALGLGFSPFPLDALNKTLDAIAIGIPPSIGDCPGTYPQPVGKVCFDDFHFSCRPSGDKDSAGNDIYKVIRKLGTGP